MKKWITIACAIVALPAYAQLQQGVALYEQKRYEEAKKVLAPLSGDPEAVKTLGLIALRQNDAERASDLFEKAAELRPSSAEIHFHLGEAYGALAMRASIFKQASLATKVRNEFERAVELDPNLLDARFGLIDFYTMAPGIMGGSAEKAAQQATEIRKRDAYLGHRAFARVYSRQKKVDLARKEWLDFVKEQPQSARAHAALGSFLGMTDKKIREGFEEIDTALHLDPGFMPAWFRLGQLAGESGAQLPRGEEALRKYLAYQPKDNEPDLASAHYYLGMVYEKQGKKAAAKEAYAAAVRLNPSVPPFQEALKRVS